MALSARAAVMVRQVRIEIWDASGTAYDNGVGQPIGGGSIVIHTARK